MEFNMKLEVSCNINSVSLTELNMTSFSRSVADAVERCGRETWFYTMDSGGRMKYPPEEPHNITLDVRLVEPSLVSNAIQWKLQIPF